MRKPALVVLTLLIPLSVVTAAPPAQAQSIQTDGNIEADSQLVSNVATGTAPLAVASETMVENLNADRLDGRHGASFALVTELLATIAALNNPAPPCFNTTQRFVNCGNGTVTDTVTGLIYLENANCFGRQDWPTANLSAAALADGQCGLTDGSRIGDWRLQTSAELKAILAPPTACSTGPEIVGNGQDGGCYSDNSWASGVEESSYWSSGTWAKKTLEAWAVDLSGGLSFTFLKDATMLIWPVRDGH